jgi:hypothetical protein
MIEMTRQDLLRLKPLSTLELRFQPLDFVMHWHRCSLTADYFAAHLAYTFDNRDEARAVLSTVANELLENAVKFSSDKSLPASLTLNHFGEWLAIETRNRTDARRASALAALERDFDGGSAEALFLARIESTAGNAGSPSGLGLLVLKKDYGVRLAIEIEPIDEDNFDVFVQALIHTDELEVR